MVRGGSQWLDSSDLGDMANPNILNTAHTVSHGGTSLILSICRRIFSSFIKHRAYFTKAKKKTYVFDLCKNYVRTITLAGQSDTCSYFQEHIFASVRLNFFSIFFKPLVFISHSLTFLDLSAESCNCR